MTSVTVGLWGKRKERKKRGRGSTPSTNGVATTQRLLGHENTRAFGSPCSVFAFREALFNSSEDEMTGLESGDCEWARMGVFSPPRAETFATARGVVIDRYLVWTKDRTGQDRTGLTNLFSFSIFKDDRVLRRPFLFFLFDFISFLFLHCTWHDMV